MRKRWERVQRVIITGGKDELDAMREWCYANGYKPVRTDGVYRFPMSKGNPSVRLTVFHHWRMVGERVLGKAEG